MGKRKGHVVIECGSRDDLQRVCQGLLRRSGSTEGPEDAHTADDPGPLPAPAGAFGEDTLYPEI
jgi:hypothetical protein